MILKIEFFIKIVIWLTCLIVIRKYNPDMKKFLISIFLFTICSVVLTGFVGIASPKLNEQFKLTALGERNPVSQSDEVVLLGMHVDGKEVGIGIPEEGKWFWGSYYMWRNENDLRQPEGTTHSVTFNIPLGWERYIELATNQWNGYVHIECLGQSQIYDTYSEEWGTMKVSLPSSIKRNLILQHTLQTIIYGLVMFGELGLCICLTRKDYVLCKKGKNFIKYNLHYFACGIIAAMMFLQMLCYADNNTFWNDEIWQINFCLTHENPLKTLLISHNTYYTDLVGNTILSLWYQIAPYGEKWLLLPQELAVAVGVYIVGIATNCLQGLRTAIFATIIGASFSSLVFQCAYEFRTYGFLFLWCSITFYFYIKLRKEKDCSWKKIMLLGVMLWLPASSHIFGVFFSAGLVLTDLILALQKQLPIKWIQSYIIAGMLYIPWLYNMICYDALSIHAGWQSRPTVQGIFWLLKYLTGWSVPWFFLLFVGICSTLYSIKYEQSMSKDNANLEIAPVIVLSFVILLVFVYGRYINLSATMWLERYFIVLFPITMYLCAKGADVLCSAIIRKEVIFAVCGAIVIHSFINNLSVLSQPAPTSYQHFKEAADWFYTQQNVVYNDDTLIVYAPDAPAEAWQEYYTTRQGLRDPLEVVSQFSLSEKDLLNKNLVYFYYEHVGILDGPKNILEQNGLVEVADDNYLKIRTYMRQ